MNTSPSKQDAMGYLIYGFTPKVDGKPITAFSDLISYISGISNPASPRHGDQDVFRKHPAIEALGFDHFLGPMSFVQSGGRKGPYFIGVADSEVHTNGSTPVLLDLKFKSLQGFEHRVTMDNYLSKHNLAVKTEDIDWHFIVSNVFS